MHGYGWLATFVTVAILAGFSSVILVMLLGQSRVFFAMSRDGLVPHVFSETHPKFRTPYKSNLIFFLFVGAFAAFVPEDIVGDMTSIGTLFAFMLVCGGVWILRVKQPELQRDFRTPLVPLVPILGIIVCGGDDLRPRLDQLAAPRRLAGDRPRASTSSTAASTRSSNACRAASAGRPAADAIAASGQWRRRWPARAAAASPRRSRSTGGMLNVARMTWPGSVADIFQRRIVCTMQSPTSSSSVDAGRQPDRPGEAVGLDVDDRVRVLGGELPADGELGQEHREVVIELHPVDLQHRELVRRSELDRVFERRRLVARWARETRSGARPRRGSVRRRSCPASTR